MRTGERMRDRVERGLSGSGGGESDGDGWTNDSLVLGLKADFIRTARISDNTSREIAQRQIAESLKKSLGVADLNKLTDLLRDLGFGTVIDLPQVSVD